MQFLQLIKIKSHIEFAEMHLSTEHFCNGSQYSQENLTFQTLFATTNHLYTCIFSVNMKYAQLLPLHYKSKVWYEELKDHGSPFTS